MCVCLFFFEKNFFIFREIKVLLLSLPNKNTIKRKGRKQVTTFFFSLASENFAENYFCFNVETSTSFGNIYSKAASGSALFLNGNHTKLNSSSVRGIL